MHKECCPLTGTCAVRWRLLACASVRIRSGGQIAVTDRASTRGGGFRYSGATSNLVPNARVGNGFVPDAHEIPSNLFPSLSRRRRLVNVSGWRLTPVPALRAW